MRLKPSPMLIEARWRVEESEEGGRTGSGEERGGWEERSLAIDIDIGEADVHDADIDEVDIDEADIDEGVEWVIMRGEG